MDKQTTSQSTQQSAQQKEQIKEQIVESVPQLDSKKNTKKNASQLKQSQEQPQKKEVLESQAPVYDLFEVKPIIGDEQFSIKFKGKDQKAVNKYQFIQKKFVEKTKAHSLSCNYDKKCQEYEDAILKIVNSPQQLRLILLDLIRQAKDKETIVETAKDCYETLVGQPIQEEIKEESQLKTKFTIDNFSQKYGKLFLSVKYVKEDNQHYRAISYPVIVYEDDWRPIEKSEKDKEKTAKETERFLLPGEKLQSVQLGKLYKGKPCSLIQVQVPKNEDFGNGKSNYVINSVPTYQLYLGFVKEKKSKVSTLKLKLSIDAINYCRMVRVHVNDQKKYYEEMDISDNPQQSITQKFQDEDNEELPDGDIQ